MASTAISPDIVKSKAIRWSMLISCVICMILIANLQYGWTLLVNPINKAHHWSIVSIQFAFSVFIALETWLTPVGGWIVDMLGAKRAQDYGRSWRHHGGDRVDHQRLRFLVDEALPRVRDLGRRRRPPASGWP